MRDDDREYLERRATQERERSEQCSDATVASAHRRMAEAYEQRVGEKPADLQVVAEA